MNDHLGAGAEGGQGGGIVQVAADDLWIGAVPESFATGEDTEAPAVGRQGADQLTAQEAGRPGYRRQRLQAGSSALKVPAR